jgi:hypothetical protein
MEQMPCGEFEANALYFAIGVLAYNLGERLATKLVRHAPLWVLKVKADAERWCLVESARACCTRLAG